jgi:hypothetical protein
MRSRSRLIPSVTVIPKSNLTMLGGQKKTPMPKHGGQGQGWVTAHATSRAMGTTSPKVVKSSTMFVTPQL